MERVVATTFCEYVQGLALFPVITAAGGHPLRSSGCIDFIYTFLGSRSNVRPRCMLSHDDGRWGGMRLFLEEDGDLGIVEAAEAARTAFAFGAIRDFLARRSPIQIDVTDNLSELCRAAAAHLDGEPVEVLLPHTLAHRADELPSTVRVRVAPARCGDACGSPLVQRSTPEERRVVPATGAPLARWCSLPHPDFGYAQTMSVAALLGMCCRFGPDGGLAGLDAFQSAPDADVPPDLFLVRREDAWVPVATLREVHPAHLPPHAVEAACAEWAERSQKSVETCLDEFLATPATRQGLLKLVHTNAAFPFGFVVHRTGVTMDSSTVLVLGSPPAVETVLEAVTARRNPSHSANVELEVIFHTRLANERAVVAVSLNTGRSPGGHARIATTVTMVSCSHLALIEG